MRPFLCSACEVRHASPDCSAGRGRRCCRDDVKRLAQEPSRPTLTITRFEGKLKSSQTADAGADLADAIATRVEESGCCRVMLRAFLPQARPGSRRHSRRSVRPPLPAACRYVIAGRAATTTRTIRRPAAPSIATLLGQLRPGAPAVPAGSMRGPLAPRLPHPISARPLPVTLVTLEMRIIDAASGQVLRTVTVTRPADANVVGAVADSPDVSDALIRAISSLARGSDETIGGSGDARLSLTSLDRHTWRTTSRENHGPHHNRFHKGHDHADDEVAHYAVSVSVGRARLLCGDLWRPDRVIDGGAASAVVALQVTTDSPSD